MPPPTKKVTLYMVTHKPESTDMPTLRQWEERTSWTTILSGGDVPEGNEFYRCEELADKFTDTERWTNEADDDDSNATVVIAHDARAELADDDSEPPLWWPCDTTKPVDKLTAYAGVRELSRAEAARALGLEETSVIESLGWVFSYPGLDKVAKAAKARGVNPWGVLGAVMAWVAADIPPEVTTLSEEKGKGTFNLFVALCGQPGTGKGLTARLGSELVRREVRGNFITAGYNKPVRGMVGSPEGMISALRPRTPADDDDDEDDQPAQLARVIFVIDEMNRLYGERRTQESTQEGTLLSMWSNENVGVMRKHEKDTLIVDEWTYRACFLVGAQAKWVHRLASETSAGLAQRWLYLPAATTHVKRPELGRKRNTTVAQLPTIDIPAEVWGATTPVVIDDFVQYCMELQAYYIRQADADKRPVDPFKVHRAYNQARVAAALSVITRGRLEVSNEAWHLAGAVMDVSDLTRERISREYEHRERRDRVEAAADKVGIHDDAVVRNAEKRIVRALKDNGGAMPGGKVRNALSKPQREVSEQAVSNLKQSGAISIEEVGAEGGKAAWYLFKLNKAG